jgi:hypothetical protein
MEKMYWDIIFFPYRTALPRGQRGSGGRQSRATMPFSSLSTSIWSCSSIWTSESQSQRFFPQWPLNGTPGNYTIWCLVWCFRLLCRKSTSSTLDGFSLLLCSWITSPAPEKYHTQSLIPRCSGVRPNQHPCPTQYLHYFSPVSTKLCGSPVGYPNPCTTLAEITSNTSFYLLWKYQRRPRTQRCSIHTLDIEIFISVNAVPFTLLKLKSLLVWML